MDDLANLAMTAEATGWAVDSVELHTLRVQARDLGWQEVATRAGDGPVSVLRPSRVEEARPRSLSAVHGLGKQPLHTDGAHLEPPEFVILHAAVPNGTATLLWSDPAKVTNPAHPRIGRPA